MEDYLFTLVMFVLGAMLGWWGREAYAAARIKTLMQTIENLEPEYVRIRIERNNGMIFIYNMETDEFMAQGETRNVVERNLQQRFPDTVFAATNENLKEVFPNDPI